MGNICYQLPSDFSSYRFGTSFGFSNADVSKIEKAFSLGRIVIKAPIGSVEIAANRETLQLKEKTIRFIGERLIKIYEDIESHFNKMYDSFTKDYERRLFSSNFNYYAKYHKFHKLRGKFSNVSSSYQISEFVGADKPISSIRTYQKSRRGNRRVRGSSGYAYELPLGDNILHLVCYGKDTITDTSLLKRITPLIELEKNCLGKIYQTIHLLFVEDQAKFDKFCLEQKYDYPILDVTTLVEVAMKDIYPSLNKPKSPSSLKLNGDKNSARYLEFCYNKLNTNTIDAKWNAGMAFEPVKVNKTPKVPHVYVVTDHYHINGSTHPTEYAKNLETLKKTYGINIPNVVLAMRGSEARAIEHNKHFIPLNKFISKIGRAHV